MEVVCRDASSGHDVTRVRGELTLEFCENTFYTCKLLSLPLSLPPSPSFLPSFSPSLPPSQMLSLSLLDAIFSIDHQGSWLKFLVTRGYLAKLCASLLWEDEGLQKMLHPQPEALKALYIHESKMVTNSHHSI